MISSETKQKAEKRLHQLMNSRLSREDVLAELSEADLIEVLSPNFRYTGQEERIGSGDGILPGDVSGQLVLDRHLGERLLAEAEARGTSIDILYSLPGGDLEDFHVLQSSQGFFTNQKGRTTFCPVQASCEGIPAVVAVNCTYNYLPETQVVTYTFHDGSMIALEQPKRLVVFQGDVEVPEGQFVSMSGSTGSLYAGALEVQEALVSRVYRLLGDCYLEAIDKYGPAQAEARLTETHKYAKHYEWLVEAVNSDEFQYFQSLVHQARELAELKVYSTAHTAKGMVQTRMFGSLISVGVDGHVQVKAESDHYGLGLLRDERMWNDHEGIDLMRVMFLGADVVGDKYEELKQKYLTVFSDMLYEAFKVGVGAVSVIRLLCMPFKMIFTDKFDAAAFASKFGLDEKLVEARAKVLGSESEAYHGCRGVRVTVQREDICDLWCEGVLRAAKRANDEGVPTTIQILLSLVTFPQEVEMFIQVYERKIQEMLGSKPDWVRGVSIMVETSGSYHLIEDIMNVGSHDVHMNGALFGGNDFTAACLNMNRADSGNLIIPAYVQLGIFEKSPFQTLNKQVVGKAVVNGLRKTRSVKRQNQRDYLMGLGGEVAGDWESVQWLASNAAIYGLNYVSTPPERILFSLFASAQASIALNS